MTGPFISACVSLFIVFFIYVQIGMLIFGGKINIYSTTIDDSVPGLYYLLNFIIDCSCYIIVRRKYTFCCNGRLQWVINENRFVRLSSYYRLNTVSLGPMLLTLTKKFFMPVLVYFLEMPQILGMSIRQDAEIICVHAIINLFMFIDVFK